jgi:uncharacterized protein
MPEPPDTRSSSARSSGCMRAGAGIPADASLIDSDVHALLPSIETLYPYLSGYWRSFIDQTGASWFYTPFTISYPPGAPTTGPGPKQDDTTQTLLGRLREESLDPWAVDRAVVSCFYPIDMFHNIYLSEALARAVNDWLVTEWLVPERRLSGSLLVPAEYPDGAVAEIDRLGEHPSIVQVLLPARSRAPYGHRSYHPIFEAAARHGLAVAIHSGGWPGGPPTGVGWPSHYIEDYAGRAQIVQTQLMSLVTEGVFGRVPETRLVLVEAGWAWLPPFLWRFDKDWKGLRREVPWVARRPSEYVRDHVKLTLQPFDGPRNPQHFQLLLDQIGSEDFLMFSTDYPHRHYDSAADILPSGLNGPFRQKVLSETARKFYRSEV